MQDKSVKGLFSTKSQSVSFSQAFLCWSPQRKSMGNPERTMQIIINLDSVRRLAKSTMRVHLSWLRISVFRGPNGGKSDAWSKKSCSLLVLWRYRIVFPSQERKKKKKPLLYNLKTRLFIYLQCKGTVQGPTLTAVSGVAPAPQSTNSQLLSLLLGNLLY